MNKKEFGKLIQTLRKECFNEDLHSLTQEELAQKTGLSVRTIIRLEKGDEAVKLQGKELEKLADALQLTSGERKEIFLAASGIENNKVALTQYHPAEILDSLIQLMKKVYAPAFIMDSYHDLIAVNSGINLLYGIESSYWPDLTHYSTNFNNLRFYFSPEFTKQQEMMGMYWDEVVRYNIIFFRVRSLQYRTTRYFTELFSELRNYPRFIRYWRDAYWQEKDYIIDGGHHNLNSPLWGKLEYIVSRYTALTTYGDLMLCVYTPASLNTFETFSNIVKQASLEISRLGIWPKETDVEG